MTKSLVEIARGMAADVKRYEGVTMMPHMSDMLISVLGTLLERCADEIESAEGVVRAAEAFELATDNSKVIAAQDYSKALQGWREKRRA